MSNILLFSFHPTCEYKQYKKITDGIVRLALKNDKGVIFNFLGYAEELIKSLGYKSYFSVSDDFFELNSEFLTTSDIEKIETQDGEKLFRRKFVVLDRIAHYLKENGIKEFDILIDTCCAEKAEDFTVLTCDGEDITGVLYDYVVAEKDSSALDFTSIIVRVKSTENKIIRIMK